MKHYLKESIIGLFLGVTILLLMLAHPPLNFISAHACIALYALIWICALNSLRASYKTGGIDIVSYICITSFMAFLALLMTLFTLSVSMSYKFLVALADNSAVLQYLNYTIWYTLLTLFFAQIIMCIIQVFKPVEPMPRDKPIIIGFMKFILWAIMMLILIIIFVLIIKTLHMPN